ncbi:MAG: S8 family peptidase [Acidobacteriota bacterium]
MLRCSVVLLAVGFFWLIPLTASQRQAQDAFVRHAHKVSPAVVSRDAENQQKSAGEARLPVIVTFREQSGLESMSEAASARLGFVKSMAAELDGRQVRRLLESDLVEYVTLDAVIRTTSDASSQIGRGDLTSSFLRAIGADRSPYTGQGVTVAVFDSGIAAHPDLQGRILASVDFTSGEAVEVDANRDNYGHGTHVAGIIAGSGRASAGRFAGVAPGAGILDLKVVGDDGMGRTSNLIRAMEWVVAHKDRFGIRVANLSVSRPPLDPHELDPLCAAAARLVEAGIVTVASAGNWGSWGDEYPFVIGGIASPGISPAVITVGPIDTAGSATHRDDIGTSFGSRGPTIDGLFKPDLAAPGRRVYSLLAPGSVVQQNYPERIIGESYVRLSGASQATPFVSGAVARILEANPRLSPAMVKTILMLSAARIEGAHILEQGNGMLNLPVAIRSAQALSLREGLQSVEVQPYWFLSEDEKIWAGGAMAFGNSVLYSSLVDAGEQEGPALWGSGTAWSDRLDWEGGNDWLGQILAGMSLGLLPAASGRWRGRGLGAEVGSPGLGS